MEAKKYVWDGAIPVQVHLHDSDVTALPPPPPAIILAPRIGYLPLLVPLIKPYFSDALPPGEDTVWFEYKGLPLKWHIPTGVLFDVLCTEPERPWNLTVHFRGYPTNVLVPCEGEDTVKWSFINSLKEASYIINGNCKSVMNMSQSDQVDLWNSVLKGNLEAFSKVSSKLKLGPVEDEYAEKNSSSSLKLQESIVEPDATGQAKTGRIPVRLYVWSVTEDFDDFEDAPQIDSWDKISYINRPVEVQRQEGNSFTLCDAVKSLLPEFFGDKPLINLEISRTDGEDKEKGPKDAGSDISADESANPPKQVEMESGCQSNGAVIKLVRIQGIEPKLEIPFSWVANNLMCPDHFLHICVCIKVPPVSSL